MLPTAPATTLLWAWRLRRAADCDDERFQIAFVHVADSSTQNWSCDRVARTEDEARAYALQHGVSPGSFTDALEKLRAICAAGNSDYVLSIRAASEAQTTSSRSAAPGRASRPVTTLPAGGWNWIE